MARARAETFTIVTEAPEGVRVVAGTTALIPQGVAFASTNPEALIDWLDEMRADVERYLIEAQQD